jgi:hypothetical protein
LAKNCDKPTKKRGKSLLSVGYTFASFFGAVMIAAAYAYFNYKFSEYRFVDFGNEMVFYNNKTIFEPKDDYYAVFVYSSNMPSSHKVLEEIDKEYKILAVDLYQKRLENDGQVIHITAGTNTLLKFVQKFNIYNVPTVFLIKKIKGTQYKQDSMIQAL